MLKSEPSIDDTISLNTYFAEDGPTNPDEAVKNQNKGTEIWTGKGEFILSDFGKLVVFLNSMISDNEIKKIGENGKK